jgi:hypothetical protein
MERLIIGTPPDQALEFVFFKEALNLPLWVVMVIPNIGTVAIAIENYWMLVKFLL